MTNRISFSVPAHPFAEKIEIEGDERTAVLVTDAQAGNAESFSRLYHLHVRAVYAYVLARLGTRQDAEDVTAQAFERAWTSLRGYRPTGSFVGWLFTIVRRTLADHYRRHSPQLVPIDGLTETLIDSAVNMEESTLAAEQMQGILRIVASLGQDQQDIIALRFIAQLRYGDIAQVMGKRESAVKMLAQRALHEIRRRYEHEDLHSQKG